MYTYAWYHWLTFFYIYCFFGWIFESTYVSLKQHHFVNRGFLRLPMLPLYGTGAVMMLWVSLPVKDNLLLVYCSGVVAATLLEYVTGYIMERLFKVRYWDYSSQKFNLHGYICLTSSIAWGFLTIFMTEIIHRPIERFVLNLPPSLEWCLLGIVSGCFVMDTIQSTREALSLAKTLESVSKLRADLEEMQVQLALLKAETEQNIENAKEALRAAVAENVRSTQRDGIRTQGGSGRSCCCTQGKGLLAEAVEAHKEACCRTKEELSEAASEAAQEAVATRGEELAEAAAALGDSGGTCQHAEREDGRHNPASSAKQ
ncbi:MAG: putative ABC transporter permease [Clostridium sp.]